MKNPELNRALQSLLNIANNSGDLEAVEEAQSCIYDILDLLVKGLPDKLSTPPQAT